MSGYVWYNPILKRRYLTAVPDDPNVPAGYILTATSDGSLTSRDGLIDDNAQQYVGGLYSGGYPAYNGNGDLAIGNGKLGG